MMTIIANDYYLKYINHIIKQLSYSTAGYRTWSDSNKPGRRYDYCVVRSTFPNYSKFFYEKKRLGGLGGRSGEIEVILLKSISKKLTVRQGDIVERLFINFYQEERDFYEEWGENLIEGV